MHSGIIKLNCKEELFEEIYKSMTEIFQSDGFPRALESFNICVRPKFTTKRVAIFEIIGQFCFHHHVNIFPTNCPPYLGTIT